MIEFIGLPGSGKSTYANNSEKQYFNILEKYVCHKSRVVRNLKKLFLIISLLFTNPLFFIKIIYYLYNIKFRSFWAKIKMITYSLYTTKIVQLARKHKEKVYIDEGILMVIWSILYLSENEDYQECMDCLLNIFSDYICDEIIFIDTDIKTIEKRLLLRNNPGGSELEHDIKVCKECLKKAYGIMDILFKTINEEKYATIEIIKN